MRGGTDSLNPDGTITVTYGGSVSRMYQMDKRNDAFVAAASAADNLKNHDQINGMQNRWSTSAYDPDDKTYPAFILELMKHPPSFGAAERIHLYSHSTSRPNQLDEYKNAYVRLLLLAEDDRARFQEETGIDFAGPRYFPEEILHMNTDRGFLWTPSLDRDAAVYNSFIAVYDGIYDDELLYKMRHCPPSFTLALSLHESSVELARLNPKRARDYAQAAQTVAIMEAHTRTGLYRHKKGGKFSASKGGS